jgi:serine/threonine protein kinase/tetratricopeptide (TPR) repeat protein
MDRDRWNQVKAIFDAALDQEPSGRDAFVDGACAGDLELRALVQALLASDDMSTSFLEPPVQGAAVALLSEAADRDGVNRQVGNYRLLEPMGSGGMATVYRAVRADGEYDEQVAVKVIKRGMASDDLLRRFREERQTLAGLEHPNIARLLDGGAADDGTPYLVLEYVDGKPIHEYCDEQELSVTGRLKLFQTVCLAVQYAHRNLVVHRDLKPRNILVTRDGTPKLVDFGIAKILKGDVSDEPQTVTVTAQRLMTPQYASPEQIGGEPITTSSDVYSLGVILYELLTGHRPYDLRGEARQEAKRLVRDVDPDTPSTAVTLVKEATASDGTTRTITPESISRARDTQPDELRRRLRGDLDTIVLTAMHKDQQMRYASVEQLSEDIARYLQDLPVRAHRDTRRYRAAKFIRRNKVAVILVAVATLSLIGGIVGTSVGMVRAAAALERAEAEAEKARVEARKAEQVTEFLQEMLAAVSPYEQGQGVTVRGVLDAAAERLETELADEAAIRAVLHRTIGMAYRGLGLYGNAEVHLRAAVDLFRSLNGGGHPGMVRSLNDLGVLLRRTGDYEDAEGALREALDICIESPDYERRDVAATLANLALLLADLGRYADAEAAYREALLIWDELPDSVDDSYPVLLHNLANTLRARADYPGAEEFARKALAVQRSLMPEKHPNLALILNGLAATHKAKGDYGAAEQLYREALAISREVLGREHPHTVSTLSNLAVLLTAQGHFDEAKVVLTEVLEIRRKIHGSVHAGVALSLNNLAGVLQETGDLEQAEQLFREALTIHRRLFGDSHEHVAVMIKNLADVLCDQGNYDSAEPLYREAMTIWRQQLGDNHPRVAHALTGLGRVLSAKGRHADAKRLIEEGLAIRRRTLPEGHPYIARSLYALGIAALARGDAVAAEPPLRECVEIRRGAFPEGHWKIACVSSALGEALTELEEYEEAESLLLPSLPILEETRSPQHKDTRATWDRIIELYDVWGKPEQAAEYRARLLAQKSSPPEAASAVDKHRPGKD